MFAAAIEGMTAMADLNAMVQSGPPADTTDVKEEMTNVKGCIALEVTHAGRETS